MTPYTAIASRKNIQKNCLEILADITLFSTLITQKLVFAIWGLCWYNFLGNLENNIPWRSQVNAFMGSISDISRPMVLDLLKKTVATFDMRTGKQNLTKTT